MDCQFCVARFVSRPNEFPGARREVRCNLTHGRVRPGSANFSSFLTGSRILHPLSGISCGRIEIERHRRGRVRWKHRCCAFGANGALSTLECSPEGEFVAERAAPDGDSDLVSPVEQPER